MSARLQFWNTPCPTLCYALPALTTAAAPDLGVQLGAVRLRNPIIAASGTFGYGLEFAHLVDLNRLGASGRQGPLPRTHGRGPAPRLIQTPSGMLNAVGLQNIGVRAFIAEKLPALRKLCHSHLWPMSSVPASTTTSKSSKSSKMPTV